MQIVVPLSCGHVQPYSKILEHFGKNEMSVRKRTWTNRDGSQGEAWVVNYTDRGGVRRLKSFERKRDAESFEIAVAGEVRAGLHVPDSQSIMVAEAARLWLESCEAAGLE